ncbi:hypothetical protein CE91St36_26540 [Christensenellaceae bacterium]|nr:hypothetical protein CE91St36_26540 [Christensenellaceae bacterium]BDF62501.1 hypothetical protein CE91St37_26510 [Christensenellaceae bacterium]
MEREIRTVYHYCSVESFYGIISNCTLRLSDIDKSNDYMERKWLQKFILETALEEYEKEPFAFSFADGGNQYEGREAVRELIDYELKSTGQHWYDDFITYAICFSEKEDSLSQWRGYADDGNGVCIGFRADKLQEKLVSVHETEEPGHTFQFQPIRYTEQEQKDMVRPYIRSIFNILNDLLKQNVQPTGEIIKLFRAINGESAFCKNPAFNEEHEWRLAVNFPLPTLNAYEKFEKRSRHVTQKDIFSRIKTAVAGKTIKSYVELNLQTIGMDALTSIRLGPKCRLSKNDVKLFLYSEGLALPDESILSSAATYR